MKRRAVIGGLAVAGAAVISVTAQAQKAGSTPRVGVLMSGAEDAPENVPRIAAFRQGLAALGWRDGQNVRIDYRWSAGSTDLIRQYARELVALAPDVILANSTPVIEAFKEIGTAIPIVFALAIDPVGLGQVKSLSRPGGNLTGFTFIDRELIGKWMELLKEVAPKTTRASVLFDPGTSPFYETFVRETTIDLAALPVRTTAEIEQALIALGQKPGSGLMVGPDPFNQVRLSRIAQLARDNGIPAISAYRSFAAEGGLMAYGPDTADVFRRAADYVDRVLKGAKPADLPVQQPVKFELAINRGAAKALGLDIPARVMVMADEVID